MAQGAVQMGNGTDIRPSLFLMLLLMLFLNSTGVVASS